MSFVLETPHQHRRHGRGVVEYPSISFFFFGRKGSLTCFSLPLEEGTRCTKEQENKTRAKTKWKKEEGLS
jgi:hypothetical protein